MHLRTIAASATLAAGALATSASAAMMHPELGARLSGMGMSGIVNLTSTASSGRLCWTFDLKASGLTGASIRDAAGMSVAKLGSAYSAKGCTSVERMALEAIETKPGSYRVWVDTKSHPGDLRGTLFAGMATTSHM